MKVAIVGGGISGFSMAYFLSLRFPSFKIEVFEKNDNLGGRMATRRINNQFSIDTGCQYLSIDQNDLRDFLFRTLPPDEIKEIPLPIICLPDGWVVDTQDRYYFRSGMTAWTKALAEYLVSKHQVTIHMGQHIENIQDLQSRYDHVFVTIPNPQAQKLGALQHVEYSPSLTLIFNWHKCPADLLGYYGFRDLSGRPGVTWLAHEGLKREKQGIWVAQMGPDKSMELKEHLNSRDLMEDLLNLDLIEWMPIMSEGEKTLLDLKYWNHAFPVSLVDPSEQLGFEFVEHATRKFTYFTGDAYLGVGRVENALQACLKTVENFSQNL